MDPINHLPPIPLNPEQFVPPRGDRVEARLDSDTIDLLRDEMRLAARQGAKEGVLELMNEEHARRFFKVGTAVVREEFKLRAGGWLFDRVGSVFSKGFWLIVLAGAVLYYAGPKVLGMLIAAALSSKN